MKSDDFFEIAFVVMVVLAILGNKQTKNALMFGFSFLWILFLAVFFFVGPFLGMPEPYRTVAVTLDLAAIVAGGYALARYLGK